MNKQEIISAYNKHERIDVAIPGCTKYISPEIIKMVSSAAHGSHISYFNLSPDNMLQSSIRRAILKLNLFIFYNPILQCL